MLGSRTNPSPLSSLDIDDDDDKARTKTHTQLLTKTNRPTTASPRTAENNRKKLGGLLSTFGFGGSPLRRIVGRDTISNKNDLEGESSASESRNRFAPGPVRSFEQRMKDFGLSTKGKNVDNDLALDWKDDKLEGHGQTVMETCHLSKLPDELLLQILSFLPSTPNQILLLSIVCQRFYQLSQAPILWAKAFDSTPAFKLDTYARDNGVAVRLPPRGKWQGASWIPEEKSKSINLPDDILSDEEEEIGKGAIPIHFPTLYRSRQALKTQICNPNQYPPQLITLSQYTESVYCVQSFGRWLVTGSRDRTIRFWYLPFLLRKDGEEEVELIHTVHAAHQGSILGLQFESLSMNKGILVTCSSDETAIIWSSNFDTGPPNKEEDNANGSGYGRSVKVEKVSTLTDHQGGVLDILISRKHIITCGRDTTIRVYDRKSFECKYVLRAHEGAVNCLATNNLNTEREVEAEKIVSVGGDGKWIMWDIENGLEIRRNDGYGRGLACVSWQGDYIVTGDNAGLINLYQASSGTLIPAPNDKSRQHDELVRAIQLDIEGGWIISGSYDKTICLWGLNTDEMIVVPQGDRNSLIFDVEFRTNRIISARQDGTVQITTFGKNLPYSELFA